MYIANEFIWITCLTLALWYWWDTVRTKEIARKAGMRACEQGGVQFLDDTVVRHKIRLRRDQQGRLQWNRIYGFEFSSDGEYRYKGMVELLGHRIKRVHMEPYRIGDQSPLP
jgi:hypothetical protein